MPESSVAEAPTPKDARVKRLTINMPISVFDELQERAETRGLTITELIRRAVALDNYLTREMSSSDRLLIERREDNSLRELVFVD